jgi:hypothetical protein
MQDSTGPLPPDVADALHRGNKIEAIKRLRTATGLGLAEAKDRIDAHEVAHPRTSGGVTISAPVAGHAPGLSPGQVPNTGQGLLVVIGVALAGLAAWLILHFGR